MTILDHGNLADILCREPVQGFAGIRLWGNQFETAGWGHDSAHGSGFPVVPGKPANILETYQAYHLVLIYDGEASLVRVHHVAVY